MLRVQTANVREGMRLAMPVYHPEHPDTTLLKTGYTLDPRGIERLTQLGIPELWIDYPGLDFIAEHVCPEVLQARGRVNRLLNNIFERLATDSPTPLQYAAYKDAISTLTEKLFANPKTAMYLIDIAEGGSSFIRHSSEVTYLSLLMGLKLEWYLIAQRKRVSGRRAKEVVNLGVAAMLHDIGMLMLDDEVVHRWSETQDETDPEWRKHVSLGYRHVRGGLDATALAAIVHHHQHYDGSGFPVKEGPAADERGLAGDEIHVFARIVAAADLFDRLRHPPDGAPTRPAVSVLRQLMAGPYRDWLDPTILGALISVAPPYAPGSVVVLSDGARAVVTKRHEDEPCRPTVRLLDERLFIPGQTEAGDPREIDLRSRTDLCVAEIDGVDVTDDNFYASHAEEFLSLCPTERGIRDGRRLGAREEAA